MANEVFFDNVADYGEENRFAFYSQGANPRILEKLKSFVQQRRERITKIFMCSYLYNNVDLCDYLLSLAREGIEVNVVSIPLEGYDDRQAKRLVDYYTRLTGQQSYTKYNLAEMVYSSMKEASRNYTNLNFYIFPHMYVRSSRMRSFSRGALPYSLHIKSMLFCYQSGAGAVTITSSNLSCRDLTKDELFFAMDENNDAVESAKTFYDDIIACSIPISEFDARGDWMHYEIQIKDNAPQEVNAYLAPFYRDSPTIVKNQIKDLIRNARREIYISAEHLATDSEDDVMGCVFSERNTGVDVRCLSQVFYCDDMNQFEQERRGEFTNYFFTNANNHRRYEIRVPANRAAFCNMTRNVDRDNHVSYCVNSDVHAKYMVIDDVAVISTCNFTPTSFIYDADINIPRFDNIPNISYRGIYSEVGEIMFVRDRQICEALKSNFETISEQPSTYHR